MTNGLNGNQTRFLTYLVSMLLTILTVCAGYFFVELSQIKKDYVTIDQYRVDERRSNEAICRLESKIESLGIRIDTKLDKIILKQK